MKPAALMLQGTGSDVGKSLLTAGLARAYSRRGLAVRPFKPQNMSNNAAVTADGGEIGRAQALQARACGIAPSVHMNPVLLKPQTEVGAQVVVQGQVYGNAAARDYQALKAELLPAVLDSFARVGAGADLVLVEGAGSAAEVNLRAGDIANMGFAEAADIPVALIGDIDRGGVIASVVGTWTLLPAAERARLVGIIINKFRGDFSLFDEGLSVIERETGLACFGIVPYFPDARALPAEDALAVETAPGAKNGAIKIAVPVLSRIANFDDLDPLIAEPDVAVVFVAPGTALPGDADLVVLPGSKATLADLAFLRGQGWDIDIAAHLRRGATTAKTSARACRESVRFEESMNRAFYRSSWPAGRNRRRKGCSRFCAGRFRVATNTSRTTFRARVARGRHVLRGPRTADRGTVHQRRGVV